ncbi:DEKNAAC101545 [Brettanomyces naardenensis]|uniref:DEKNAAC101545 n=1 Tax=Brettanomyces naardenensis TaxID=13370 RepID=A0A448YIS5_BRENA|nr:DEKNAAC101545 [Brettanomyces naardenensis]
MTPPATLTRVKREPDDALHTVTPSQPSRRPMVVDVSLDDSGKQLYSLRKTRTSRNVPFGASPPPSVLGKRKHTWVEESPTLHRRDDSKGDKESFAEDDDDNTSVAATSSSSSSHRPSKRRRRISSDKENRAPDEIWSPDVETAFAEALAIIPKQGLHKIKISGCAKGRNELISDYILAKTGKARSRKQVSSHIQVIKNLHKDPAIIDLIVNGPQISADVSRKFDEVFSQISLAKSLGPQEQRDLTEDSIISGSTAQGGSPRRREENDNTQRAKSISPRTALSPPPPPASLKRVDISVKRFRFNYINMNDPPRSHNFSVLPAADAMQPPLRIRTNADLTFRFPRFFELIDAIKAELPDTGKDETFSSSLSIPPVPILHGMVKMTTPPMDRDLSDGQYNAGTVVQLTRLPASDARFCCLSLIYSFGRLILSTFEKLETKGSRKGDRRDVTCEIRLGTNYWKDFFAGLRRLLVCKMTDKSELQLLSRAIKGITMKQIVFAVSEDEYKHLVPSHHTMDSIRKTSVRAVLLWEFLRVDDPADAVTTLRRIHLPVSVHAKRAVLPRRGSFGTRKPLGSRRAVENGARAEREERKSAPCSGSSPVSPGPGEPAASPASSAPGSAAAGAASAPPTHVGNASGFSSTPNLGVWNDNSMPDAKQLHPYPESRSVPNSALSLPLHPSGVELGDPIQLSCNMTQSVDNPIGYSVSEMSMAQAESEDPFESQYLNLPTGNSPSSDETEEGGENQMDDSYLGDAHLFDSDGVTSFNMMW